MATVVEPGKSGGRWRSFPAPTYFWGHGRQGPDASFKKSDFLISTLRTSGGNDSHFLSTTVGSSRQAGQVWVKNPAFSISCRCSL